MTWISGGHNNWFAINNSGSQFKIKFATKASRLYENFDDAADHAAHLLYKEWGHRPLYLALSGGIDSEFVAKILLRNQIPFTPVILKIKSINEPETVFADKWCDENNIPADVITIGVEDLSNVDKKFFPQMHQLRNYWSTPLLYIYHYIANKNGHCVCAMGDINLDSDRREFFHCNYDFTSNLINAGQHPTSFFMYTPELALSYINKFDVNKDEQTNKLSFYPVVARSKLNYNVMLPPIDSNLMDRMWYILKIKNEKFDNCHWYGTKEQIVQQLMP